jgi:hypothetical protein
MGPARLAVALMAALALSAFLPGVARAARARDTSPPNINLLATGPRSAPVDLYAFVSPDAPTRVTFIATWGPSSAPRGGPVLDGFSASNTYAINIDNTGDARPDLVYRWRFHTQLRNPNTVLPNTGVVRGLDDPSLSIVQTYDLTLSRPGRGTRKLVQNGIAAPRHLGERSMPDYTELRTDAIQPFRGGRAFAGPADDPSFRRERLEDVLYDSSQVDPVDQSESMRNVQILALQIRREDVVRAGDATRNPVIGVWSSVSQREQTAPGQERRLRDRGTDQLARLGMPLVEDMIIPWGAREVWRAAAPEGDRRFRTYYEQPEVARLLEEAHGLPHADSDRLREGVQRTDLVQMFLTGVAGLNRPQRGAVPSDQLRLNVSIPPCESGRCESYSPLGVIGGDFAGWPNGRRLGDDVVDAGLQVMGGELLGNPNDLTDGVDAGGESFTESFPYVGIPNS